MSLLPESRTFRFVSVQLLTGTGSVSCLIDTGGHSRLTVIQRQATTLRLSIDSTDPLEDAIRVLGAMYNVTLVTPSNNTAKKASASAKRVPTATTKRGRKATTGSRTPRKKSVEAPVIESTQAAAGRVGTAELRSWAREHGFTVSDRGRIPAAISAAYNQASNN